MRPRRLQDFEGAWSFTREVAEADGCRATVTGRAVWVRDSAGLAYTETGEMRIEGHVPMQVERRYSWDSDLAVSFEDGRFFHHVPPEGGETAHWCDPDQYDGIYDFDNWPEFSVTWRVRGPRKDYRMVTCYRPEDE
ncbi:hypothetical protein RA2_03254 [Roseovarius sp. A-2]|uniref:DUF6314 family protein n=1 Tax=Roseovarius sp. A-2 TaxID=1570360 RepID=UPI0009B57A7D|nr:DUF6314 family protein [Roseovarius sp. A-2]GAW36184.1 hypothetical protein RA2_03254 [Roseovarius sp. A-2]